MKGSISQGMGELAQAIKEESFIFKDEALIMYAMLQLHLNKNETEAWKIINTSVLQPDKNLTHCFAASSIAMYTGKNDQAIKLLENRPKGPQYFPFPYLDSIRSLFLLRWIQIIIPTTIRAAGERIKNPLFS